MPNESNTTPTFEPKNQYPDKMSDQTYLTVLQQYLALPNIGADGYKKRFMLRLMGLEDRRIEELCKPMEYTREQAIEGVKELARREQKELKKWNRERRLKERA